MPTLKTPHSLPSSALCVALSALCVVHSALCTAAEPPPAAAQEGVQLWEGGPYWADRNVGAEEPWEPGYYFWWGDPVGYRRENDGWVASDGSGSDSSFRHGGNAPYAKHASVLLKEGWITTNNVLAPAHDSARAHWGGDWRMPMKQELMDLAYNKCDWEAAVSNGVKGAVVRGRGDYAKASIFLPLDGWGNQNLRERWEQFGHLWASDPRTDGLPGSWRLKYSSKWGTVDYHWDRYVGTTVRPVRGDPGPFPGHGIAAGQEGKEKPIKPTGAACPPEALAALLEAPAEPKGVRLWEGGPVWADRNIGAKAPAEPGWYFWWGDTIGHVHVQLEKKRAWVAVDGSSSNVLFDVVPMATYGRDPATLRSGGWIGEDGILVPEHDAARVNWGDAWRMPTRQELDDLCYNKCDWTWTDADGAKGFVVRGRGDYASAAIFLPVSGYGAGPARAEPAMGFLWSSSAHLDGPPTDCSWRLAFAQRFIGTDYCWDRWVAVPVRPVRDNAD